MYTYTCCRCTNCAAQIALEEWVDSDTHLVHGLPRPRVGREACPYCRAGPLFTGPPLRTELLSNGEMLAMFAAFAYEPIRQDL
jgi:hypothetical protein